MKTFLITLYLVTGFFMLALQAQPLDAPTLVYTEYSDNFLGKSAPRKQHPKQEEKAVFSYMLKHMHGLPRAKTWLLTKYILKVSDRHDIPPGLILSVIRVESNFNTWAISPMGALGLMQLMPETANWISQRFHIPYEGPADLFDEQTNIRMGVQYLAFLKDKYQGNLMNMLDAYNRGPAKVDEVLGKGKGVATGYYDKIKSSLPLVALSRRAQPQKRF